MGGWRCTCTAAADAALCAARCSLAAVCNVFFWCQWGFSGTPVGPLFVFQFADVLLPALDHPCS